jgi:molybdopterin molybdotransferase
MEVDVARGLVLERASPLGEERVVVAEALGRALAEDVTARDPVPPFTNSAMDGYALVAADTLGATAADPAVLALAGESRAGAPAESELSAGTASAISTGAAMPPGADAVAPIEDVESRGKAIAVSGPVARGRHVRFAGEDMKPGDVVVRAGLVLGPAELGVLTGVGLEDVLCARRPRVAVLTTGDELRAAGEPMEPGTIRDANAVSLPALAAEAGAEVTGVSRVGDDRVATEGAIAARLEDDVLVISGGVSVGPHDHVRPALQALGVEEVLWRVALRPGKPTWFGVAESGTLVFGLPGNPVSSMVTFLLFVRPALEAQLGLDADRRRGRARLSEPMPLLPNRMQAVRCSLQAGPEGWMVTSTGPQGSHILTSMVGADCLAFLPSGDGELAAGDEVLFELLPGASAPGGPGATLR